MKPIMGIDPGYEHSAYVVWDGAKVLDHADLPNSELRIMLRHKMGHAGTSTFAIEMLACFGMAVGKEVLETCRWVGCFQEASGGAALVYRMAIKLHLCHSARAKDANVSQALKDRFGGSSAVGTKKQPGPLYGISEHKWAALAVAVYADETGACAK